MIHVGFFCAIRLCLVAGVAALNDFTAAMLYREGLPLFARYYCAVRPEAVISLELLFQLRHDRKQVAH